MIQNKFFLFFLYFLMLHQTELTGSNVYTHRPYDLNREWTESPLPEQALQTSVQLLGIPLKQSPNESLTQVRSEGIQIPQEVLPTGTFPDQQFLLNLLTISQLKLITFQTYKPNEATTKLQSREQGKIKRRRHSKNTLNSPTTTTVLQNTSELLKLYRIARNI